MSEDVRCRPMARQPRTARKARGCDPAATACPRSKVSGRPRPAAGRALALRVGPPSASRRLPASIPAASGHRSFPCRDTGLARLALVTERIARRRPHVAPCAPRWSGIRVERKREASSALNRLRPLEWAVLATCRTLHHVVKPAERREHHQGAGRPPAPHREAIELNPIDLALSHVRPPAPLRGVPCTFTPTVLRHVRIQRRGVLGIRIEILGARCGWRIVSATHQRNR